MTLYEDLSAPFDSVDLEWKVQTCGKSARGDLWALVVPFASARAIQNRLDEAVGPERWRNRYEPITKGPDVAGYLCYLGIKIGDEWVEKCDGAELTDIEAVKGGLSGSLKRAAVQWSIGRYLYAIDECWAIISEKGQCSGKTKDGVRFNWDPPTIRVAPRAKAIDHQVEEAAEPAPIAPAAPRPAPAATPVVQAAAAPAPSESEDKDAANAAFRELTATAGKALAERAWKSFALAATATLDDVNKTMRRRTKLMKDLRNAFLVIADNGASDQAKAVIANQEPLMSEILSTLNRLAGILDDSEPPF